MWMRCVASAAAVRETSADGSTPTWSPTWKMWKPAFSAARASRATSSGAVDVDCRPNRNGRTTPTIPSVGFGCVPNARAQRPCPTPARSGPASPAGPLLDVNDGARWGAVVDGYGLMRLNVPPKAWTPAPLPVVPVWIGPELPTRGSS